MGMTLRRWLADALPSDVPSGERLLALEIADQANEETRLAYGRQLLEILARRTGLASATISTYLARLARRGWEFRVEIGKGDDGRPLYAHAGKQTTYRVPTERADPRQPFPRMGGKCAEQAKLEGLTMVSPSKVGQWSALRSDSRQPTGLTVVSPSAEKVGLSSAPSPQSSSPHRSPHLSLAEQCAITAGMAAPDEREKFIDAINLKYNNPGPQWWRTVSDNGDLGGLIEDWRKRQAHRPAAAPAVPQCGRCGPHRQIELADGSVTRCPDCHPLAFHPGDPAQARQDARGVVARAMAAATTRPPDPPPPAPVPTANPARAGPDPDDPVWATSAVRGSPVHRLDSPRARKTACGEGRSGGQVLTAEEAAEDLAAGWVTLCRTCWPASEPSTLEDP